MDYTYCQQRLLGAIGIKTIDFKQRLLSRLKIFPDRKIKIISLACGAARIEEILLSDFNSDQIQLELVDINEELLETARSRFDDKFEVQIRVEDLNQLNLPENQCDVVMCVSALHHIIELEHVVKNIRTSLVTGGEFWSIGEYVGRNGTRLYEDAYEVANSFFQRLPEAYRVNWDSGRAGQVDTNLPNADCSVSCFEGIRSEDILPILKKELRLEEVSSCDCFFWRLFNQSYLENYKLNRQEDMALLEKAIELEVGFFNRGGQPSSFNGVFVKDACGDDRIDTGSGDKKMIISFKRLMKRLFHKPNSGSIQFQCNICGNETSCDKSNLSREVASCHVCGSTVRMRAIVHVLSMELFGESLVLPEFPNKKSCRGVGMSDWDGYAKPLTDSLDYTNTYYHQEPMLDIANISEDQIGTMDFIISSDVYEHVLFPVNRAFVNTAKLLKESGVFIFTVPYSKEGEETVEHFGQLHDFEIEKKQGEYILRDTDENGKVREFNDLVFHGGPGSTLEMRVFCEKSLMKELSDAGFKNVKVYDEPYLKYGIDWGDVRWSLPIGARK